jgi:hypothetical protein
VATAQVWGEPEVQQVSASIVTLLLKGVYPFYLGEDDIVRFEDVYGR